MMGGRGSGPPRVHAGLVERSVILSTQELKAIGALTVGEPGAEAKGEIRWKQSGRGVGIAFTVELGDDGVPSQMLLTYTVNGRPMTCPVELTMTRPYFGGWRIWFRCPTCRRRCAKLHLSGWHFVCRLCARLVHRSMRLTDRARLLRQAEKVEAKLGEGGGRPKRMRWRTFWKLRDRATAYRSAAFDELLRLKRVRQLLDAPMDDDRSHERRQAQWTLSQRTS